MKTKIVLLLLYLSSIVGYAQITDAAMVTSANVIKKATVPASNTATRIGQMFLDIVKNKSNKVYTYTATGTDNYAITVDASITSESSGQWYLVKFPNTNTTSSTLSVNGRTGIAIKKSVLVSLTAGDIPPNSVLLLAYDGTNFQTIGGSSGGGGSASWGAISGTLSDQTDLQTAIDLKLSISNIAGTPTNLVDGSTITWNMAGVYQKHAALSTSQTTIDLTLSNFNTGDEANLIVFKGGASNLRINFINSTVSTYYDKNGNDITGGAGGMVLVGPANTFYALNLYNYNLSTFDAIWVINNRTFITDLPLTSGHIAVGNGSGIATDVALSGDGTMSSAGALSVTKILGNIIPSNAAGFLENNGSGTLTWSAAGGLGTVTNVSSANGSATVTSPTTAPVITIVDAPKLTTARTIGITGDLVYTSPSFDGSSNVTTTGTLATVNGNVGSFGSSSSIPSFTVNAKGLITAASPNSITAPAGGLTGTTIASGVTVSSLTSFGNSPLLVTPNIGTPTAGVATNLTGLPLTTGVTGILPVANGGQGNATLTAYAPLFGGITSTSAVQSGTLGTSGQVLTSNGAGALATFQTPAAGFTNPMTTLGDIIYEDATPVAARLAGNTTSVKKFLQQTGTGTISAIPTWNTIASGDIPTLNQNTTGSAATLTTPRTIGTITGDGTSAGSSFDGSANNTNALTLATVNSNVGPFASATQVGTFTVNGKGLITAAGNTTITPAVGSITGLGTGVSTALGVNVGSAGALVTNGGALGTPSSGVATNLTGTASGLTSGNVTTNANLTGDVTSSGNATTLANTAVTPGSYTNTNLTVDAKGRITAASNGSSGTGTVTSVTSANGAATIATTTTTPVITIVSAPKWTTARTINGTSIDGSANVALGAVANTQTVDYTTVLGDEAKVILMDKTTAINLTIAHNVHATGSIIHASQVGNGLLTIVPASGETFEGPSGTFTAPCKNCPISIWQYSANTWKVWNGPISGALTKVDDTNVTLTLGGSPSTALVNAASISVGWSGQLAVSRGGNGTNTIATGQIPYGSATDTYSMLSDVAVGSYLRSGGVSTAPLWSTLILPNAATANRLAYATSTNTYGESANATFDGTTLTIAGNKIKATATNDNAVAGNIGESGSSYIATGSAVSLTTATPANITSVSLTAGDYIVSGIINYKETTSTVTARTGGLTSTSATVPTDGSEGNNGVQSTVTSETNSVTLNGKRFSLSGTTTVYLVAQATFSAGTCAVYGGLTWYRIR